jgi:phosphodiesterase/alkaline phosphatase D-like protein
MRTKARNPFTLGVASGNPRDDSFVLWTRLAPDPLNGGGMNTIRDIEISLEIATDSSFTDTIQSAQAVAEARYAHSVHHVITGLQPNTHYWYRFSYRGHSAIGRTMTAGNRDDVKFAFVNCQNLQEGFYPVYRDIAQDDELDLVVQAYYEHMPLPPEFLQPKPFDNVRLYGKVGYGDLLQFLVLDVRQYRTLQPCGDRLADCPERYSPSSDILGPQQEAWLKSNLSVESPRWNVIANSIFMLE